MDPHYFTHLEATIKSQWKQPVLCDYRGDQFTFETLSVQMEKFHLLFEAVGLRKGDKVALAARNVARWAVSFLSINTYGTVVVPILADFHPDNINTLVDHSDSLVLFVDPEIYSKMDLSLMPKLKGVISVEDFSLLDAPDAEFKAAFEGMDAAYAAKYPNGITAEDVKLPMDNYDDLAVINYTSGTTSAPKGVMLTYGNLSASIDFGLKYLPVTPGEHMCSMLPMAHIYGLVFEFMYPVCGGVTVYYLGKTPAPSLLLKAMADVKPYAVITVPLVMEKVYKSSLKPVLDKPVMKILTSIPGVKTILFKKIREKLIGAFGGNVRTFIMGGAALNPDVEKWFKKIGLPYTVGYGMTEAAPLLAYCGWETYAPGSCGKAVDAAVVRIDSEDSQKIAGEIQAKGGNICLGYYKNEAATKDAFTDDGFLRTGDLGVIDANGNIFIRGRSKNMILSANGQNIYPEEMEAVINAQDYVVESLVVDRSGKLVALVYLDEAAMKKAGLDNEAISDIPESLRAASNRLLPSYSQISKVELQTAPFEKTPKMSIKRFLYS